MTKKKAAPTPDNGRRRPRLDLDALVEPSGDFRLGGKRFDYRSIDAMSLLEQKVLSRDYLRILELSAATDITQEESDEYEGLVRDLATRVSNMSADEASTRPISKLETAVTGFFIWRGLAIDGASRALTDLGKQAEKIRTGALSSLVLAEPTEGQPSNG